MLRGRDTIVPLILILAFLGTTLLVVNASGTTDFDLSVFRYVHRLRSPFLSNAAVFVTEFGRTPVALLFSIVAWRRSRAMAIHLATATLGAEIVLEVLKLVIRRPRPIEILPLVHATGYSFPSGHSLVAAATYTTAAILICRGLRRRSHRILVTAAAVVTIALIASSRVYLGVHYASDVIGGILLGTAWAVILEHWYDLRNVPRKDSGYEIHDHNARGRRDHDL